MPKFLLDANLSPETAIFMSGLGYDAKRVYDIGLGSADDETIAQYATTHNLMIVTFDLDFGHLFKLLAPHEVGIIILRLENQTVESVNAAVQRLLASNLFKEPENERALIIVEEATIRVRF